MKKFIFAFSVMVAMLASATVFASSPEEGRCAHNHNDLSTHVAAQGSHCSGTVGCDCPGFAPITNGDVWQQAYCRHCGHRRGVHR